MTIKTREYNALGMKETCLNCGKKSCALAGVGNKARINENDGCWVSEEKLKEDYWKITALKEYLLVLIKDDKLKDEITISEEYNTKNLIRNMKLAQEFGFQQGKNSQIDETIKLIDKWFVNLENKSQLEGYNKFPQVLDNIEIRSLKQQLQEKKK